MTILTKTTADGVIKCKTEIDGRQYRSKYNGCNLVTARKKFRKSVLFAENKLQEQMRQEIIDICLNCQVPVEQCKGKCKIKPIIKIKRGKGVV